MDLRFNWLNVTTGSAAMTIITNLQSRGVSVDYNPQNPAPVEVLLSAPAWLGASQFRFSITSAPGAVLEIQSAIQITNWVTAGTLTNTTGVTEFTDPSPSPESKFYRARLLP